VTIGRFYVSIRHNVKIQGVKVSRYVVKNYDTGKIARGTKGFGGAVSGFYETRDEAQKVADKLNKKYP